MTAPVSCQDLLRASRPGFPEGLKVHHPTNPARMNIPPSVSDGAGVPGRRKRWERGGLRPLLRPVTGKLLTQKTPAAPPLQVLMVMKDGALRTAAKKVLEEINYKGSFPILSPPGRHPFPGFGAK